MREGDLELANVTIALSDGVAQRLNVIVAEYNVANGTSLTLRAWVELHLRELAIARELSAAAQQLQEQARLDAAAALQAEKDRLLGLV